MKTPLILFSQSKTEEGEKSDQLVAVKHEIVTIIVVITCNIYTLYSSKSLHTFHHGLYKWSLP